MSPLETADQGPRCLAVRPDRLFRSTRTSMSENRTDNRITLQCRKELTIAVHSQIPLHKLSNKQMQESSLAGNGHVPHPGRG